MSGLPVPRASSCQLPVSPATPMLLGERFRYRHARSSGPSRPRPRMSARIPSPAGPGESFFLLLQVGLPPAVLKKVVINLVLASPVATDMIKIITVGMSCHSWKRHRTGCRRSPALPPVALPRSRRPGMLFPNSRGIKAAANGGK